MSNSTDDNLIHDYNNLEIQWNLKWLRRLLSEIFTAGQMDNNLWAKEKKESDQQIIYTIHFQLGSVFVYGATNKLFLYNVKSVVN